MSAGQIAINTNEASPALFFKDSNGDLVKVGPVHIGTSAPNSSPASVAATALVTGTVYQILTTGTSDFTLVGASANTVGTIFTATGTTTGTGTVSGQQGVEKGEMWLDTTGGTYVLKIYDGTAWRSESGTFVDASGDTMTGDLVMNNADIVFEGATADDFETTLTVTDPTADRIITLPDVTGNVVTTGDTGTVTSTMIANGTIVDADVNASAAISASKVQAASTSNAGVVQLNDTISSTSTTLAATANAVKTSYDLANAALPTSGGALTGDITLNAQSDLRFADSDSSNWVAFQAPATVASNVTWTLPAADGSTGQILSTDGSGTLSWASGVGTILEMVQTISENYTLQSGYNGLSAGPVAVAAGFTVTVPANATWTVV
tara:strand:+ start:8763 stop:9899 length:1137 start_codon:yes stop_codon:yes gene_type:complete